MIDEVALWKQRILERKANGQTVTDWCKAHNVTKGSYNYWRRQVLKAESPDSGPVIFAKLDRKEPARSALQVT